MNRKIPAILLVEDSEDDAFVMMRAMKKAGFAEPIHTVTDGQQAVDYLGGNGEFADRGKYPVPGLIFLDLKLPYVNGFEVLSWVRERGEFDSVKVVVLTGSPEEKDRERAFSLGAKSYLVKPPTRQMIEEVFKALGMSEGAA